MCIGFSYWVGLDIGMIKMCGNERTRGEVLSGGTSGDLLGHGGERESNSSGRDMCKGREVATLKHKGSTWKGKFLRPCTNKLRGLLSVHLLS